MNASQKQKIINKISTLEELKSFNAINISTLTDYFQEKSIKDILIALGENNLFSDEKDIAKMQLDALDYIKKKWNEIHFCGYDCEGIPEYDKTIPTFFNDLDLILKAKKLALYKNDSESKAEQIPQSPSDREFAELCKSLAEQRELFLNLCSKMNEVTSLFKGNDKKARETYQNILGNSKIIESKNKEIEDLKKQNATLKTQNDEAQKMAARVAKKSDNEKIISALKVFLTTSKNKRIEKREAAGDAVKKLIENLGISDPELNEMLDHIDDEVAQVVQNIAEQNIYKDNATHQDDRKQLNLSPTQRLPWEVDDDLPF